jgi:ubiquinone biosynthesis protein COQ9
MATRRQTTPKAKAETATDWAEATEQQVLDTALGIIPQEGWSARMAILAGAAAGLSAGETELLLPHGPTDLAALLSRRHDARALAALGQLDAKGLKIREKIARAVAARTDAAMDDEAAVRRMSGFLALPQNAALGLRLTWESADALWRWAGDTATDENHYSKRVLLAGILAGTLAVRLASGTEAAADFTARRIDNVMTFEKWKATTKLRPSLMMDAVAGALGRLRYGA